MRSSVRGMFALVMGCFLVSGVAGLVYQIAWARYLSLFLGHLSYAVVAGWVACRGGLACGKEVFVWVADLWWIPSMWLEFAVLAEAALNLIGGLGAVALSRAAKEGSDGAVTAESGPANGNVAAERFSALDLKVAVIAIGCSGFVAML